VKFVGDTDDDFRNERRSYIEKIFGTAHNNHNNNNPYFIQEESFTNQTVYNILKMWHSQDRVWRLMEDTSTNHHHVYRYYDRVAMLRLDVVYMTPIDIYRVPNDPIPMDYNVRYLQSLRRGHRRPKQDGDPSYLDDTLRNQNAYLPGFKSFPVNDRCFIGPYGATKIWASDRFERIHDHIFTVLPSITSRPDAVLPPPPSSFTGADVVGRSDGNMTRLGLHDEAFVAYSVLPAIRRKTNVTVHVDRQLYFARVRADGSIWLKDKPGFGRIPTDLIEAVLGRKCPDPPFEVPDDYGPGKWQILCPPSTNATTTASTIQH
jgi:hypothetical protein